MKEKAIGKIIGGLLICLMLGLVFGGLIDVTSATTEKTTVSVTESSPWFTKGTNSGSGPWYPHTYEGHDYISTYVGGMSGNPSQPDCWAEFKPYLSQSGKYEVYAYFYVCKDTSTKVPFTVKYDGGSTTIKVNQYRSSPTWKEKYLGTWDFKAGADTCVKVTDATGETYNGITGLSVGAIKFVKVQTTTVSSPPTLISPGSSSEPGQEINTLTPTFKWNSVFNADYYGLYVSKYPYGSSNIVFEKEGIYGTSFTLPSGKLQDGVKYRWNMRAHNSAGWSGFSSKLYFKVNIPQPPSPLTLISPGSSSEPGQEINTLTPTFKWNSVSNADYYGLYVSKYPYGSSNIVFEKEGIYGTSFTLPSGKLQDGVKYRWNMRAHNSAGWSGFSSKLYFTVNIPQPPSPPTLISPGSSSEPGQEINTLTPTFKWNSVSNADYYGLYVSKYPYGSSNIVFEKEGIYGTSFTLPSGKLQDGVKYRWNMRAHNSAGWSGFSSKLYFTVDIPQPPSPPTLISPGSSSEPGQEINTLTPTFKWNSVSNADYYGLYLSKYPYGSSNIVFEKEGIYGTSFTLPSGKLQDGVKYRWNMRAHNSAGWSGFSSKLYFTVNLPNSPPNTPSKPSGPSSGYTGTSYSYSTSATDPDGDQVKYTFDWGDGTTSENNFVNSGTSASKSHSWSSAGTYSVKAKAADSKGSSSGWSSSKTVTITQLNNPPNTPSRPSGQSSGYTGTSYSYSTSATDPDGDQVKYTFDWGDGTTSENNFVNSGTSASKSHSWSSAGTYSVKAKAADSKGSSSGWSSSKTVTITQQNLEIPTPVICGIDPSRPIACSGKQWITIIGTGFVSDSTVTLCIGSSTYPIPSDRTEFKSSSQIRVYVGLTDPGTWTARVTNQGNRLSNLFSFTVKQDIPTPAVTGIDPSQPTASPTRQWITIIGTGFVSDSTVTLCIGSSTYPIPSDRTEFKSSSQIRVYVGLTDPGTWTARVTNQGNRLSNLFSFTVKQDIPTPAVTGIDPSQPTASPTRQWITIIGTGFVSDSTVTLCIGSSTYPIPADRTEFKSSSQIRVYVGLTDPGTWTARVTNQGNRLSNLFSFTVKQDIPSPVHDMAVTNVYTTPSSPNVGQTTTIYVTVKNEGNQQENNVPVKAHVDGSQVGSTQHVTLSAGKSTTKSFTWTPSTAKAYSVKGAVGIVSGETDTSDNKKTISMEVIPAPVHDMAVTKVYTSPDSPIVGQATTIYVTVKNEGNQQENSVPVKAYVDGSKISTQYVTLPADQSTTKSFTWTPSVAKTYSVKGEVGAVSGETDTSDNSKTKSVTVNPAPVRDMAVTDVQTSPDLPTVGQSTTIYVTVKNKGNQQEKNVPVKAYVDGSQVGSAQVTLSAGKSATKSFIWTPSTAKTYSVKGEIGVVSGETDTSDNKKIIGVSVSPAPSPTPPTTPSPQTGSIRVTTNLDIAFFTITGPEKYQAIGKSWSLSNVPAGLYTITYTEIPGYIIPSSETKTLSVGGSITFSGSYTKIGLYQLPATRGKISWFSSEESGNPGAWGEWLGENLGTDEATKYWYCAMRWPYYDPNTGFFDQAAKDWWHNKKILLANPKNDKQVVMAAKDWGPTWWTGRVIDVSKTALDTLGVETDDIVNIEFVDQNAPLGPVERVKFNKGDWVEVILNLGLRVRDVPGIGSNDYWVAPKGSLGVIIDGPERKDGYTWWKIMYDHSPSVFEGMGDKKDTWPTIIGWSAEGGTDGDYFKKSSIPASLPKFLTLPFKDADIKIPQGWVYTWTSDPNAHKGIDYIKGSIDSSSSWQSFDVVAAADGWAMWSEQQGSTGVYGKFLLIRHDKKDYVGNDFFTLYAHLESVASGIPYQDRNNIDYNYNDPTKWKSVKSGEVIGRAGNTGASNTGIHLHFEVQRKAYAHYKTDPYDLYKLRSFYPGGGSYSSSGSRYLWTTDPPSLPSLHPDIGYAVLVAGQGDLKFWKIPIPWEYGTQWITNRNVNRAYQVLRSLGFDDDRILYLNNDLLQDADGDGDADVDWTPSDNGFKLAMGWARLRVGEHSPFILYLTGHGERGEFYLGSGMSDSLFVSNLNQELDKFPEKTPMLIIVDSCYSGSFITAPETISAPNRVIVTSSHDDQKVPAFSNYLFWSPEFWQCVQQGMDIRQAFIKGTKAANDALTRALWAGLISPQPADFCQPWLDDNGDSVGHPPESLGDDGNLAATMKIGVPGGPPSVGEDASNPQLFKDCYDKNGGASKLGYPVGKVHRWKKGYIQDFRGGDGYEGAIMQPDGVNYAYAVYGSIWSKYLILGGAEGFLGYPLTDELSGHVSSITGAKCRYNQFYGGAIVHHATRPKAGLTVFLGHGIFNKWEELNYGESALGLPTSDEREAPQSGADSFDTTGVVCDFEGGHLYWHRVGKYKDKAFETHGAIDGVYQQEGGPGNWLGFPISDEHKDSKTGYARSDFEGGYITTPNGIDYHAYSYTPTPSPSPTTSPTPTLTPPSVHDIAVEHPEIHVLNCPLKGKIENRQIVSGFGDIWTWTYCGGLPKKHTGVDLKANVGEDIYATYDGVVKEVYTLSTQHNWGKGVVIEHSGFTTTYMHVNPVVNVGAHVNKGQKIAIIVNIDGDEHLHFGVRSGTYSDISKRGALPQKHGDSNYQDGRFTWCKSDPLFPEKFIDPMKLKYEIKMVPKQTGLIIVSANLDQATFTIKGPKTYQGSGKSWSVSNVPTGTYKIIYEAVVKKENGKAVGYDVLKKSEEKTLIASGSVRFDVEYIKNTPPTRGKISCFCPSCCPTSAWEEPLGESCGKDDAAKYWFVAMRWPYAKWDYKIEDTVSTGLSEGSDWKNKKILVTNPKNGRQVVLEAKDWGPAPWTGRVIDVSPTALSALGAETDEEVNIELADKNAELGPPPSTKFKTGDLIVTKKKWNLRSDRKIAEECIKITLDKGSEGEVLENDDNGKFVPDNKYYWWYVEFGDYEGWCAEDGLEKSETFNEYDHDRDGIVRGDVDDLRMQYQAYQGFLSGEEYDHDKDGIIRGDADDLRMQYYKYQGF